MQGWGLDDAYGAIAMPGFSPSSGRSWRSMGLEALGRGEGAEGGGRSGGVPGV